MEYTKFDTFMKRQGLIMSEFGHCAYYKKFDNGNFIILMFYVDDMLVVGPNMKKIIDLKAQLARTFEMKDLGEVNQILWMEIHKIEHVGIYS